MSHFFYIHRDIGGKENVYKIGKAITPYSAVRARQKFCWGKVSLIHLYFGGEYSVDLLEKELKKRFRNVSGKVINGFGDEIFQVNIDCLLKEINGIIQTSKLNIVKLKLDEEYSATSSQKCPMRIPSEQQADKWCKNKFAEIFRKTHDFVGIGDSGLKQFRNTYKTTFDNFF